MINKQKMWFLTLFTLILVLSVYYITMPNNLLTVTNNDDIVLKEEVVSETEVLKDIKDEEYTSEIKKIEDTILDPSADADTVNEAYDKLNKVKENNINSSNLEEKLKSKLNIDSVIEINDNTIKVTATNEESSYSIANEIIRCIQEEYETEMKIVVKFN